MVLSSFFVRICGLSNEVAARSSETARWPAFGNDWVVMPTQARTVELELAIYQSGYTVAAIGHLSGISRERLVALLAGAEPTQQERETLQRLLANWRPGF